MKRGAPGPPLTFSGRDSLPAQRLSPSHVDGLETGLRILQRNAPGARSPSTARRRPRARRLRQGRPGSPGGLGPHHFGVPNRIASDGISTITVTARKSSGFPVNPGTPVFLSTTRGSIPTNGNTNDDGVVRVALSGNGEAGMATVKANAGAAEEVEIEVQIGIFAASLTLQASPTTIGENGGQIDLLAVVRDDTGQPLPGVTVNFTTHARHPRLGRRPGRRQQRRRGVRHRPRPGA